MTLTSTQTQTRVDERSRPLLEALAQSPDLSQRELAQRAGLSLTRTHFMLRELIDSGLVQVRTSRQSSHRLGYSYIITGEGRVLHTRLAYRALRSAVEQFRGVLRRFRATLHELEQAGVTGVGLLGEGPLCDAVRDLVERDSALNIVELDQARTVLVCDPEVESSYQGTARLVRLAGAAVDL